MDTTIMGADYDLIVGERYPAMEFDRDGTTVKCAPFVVLRDATFSEWHKAERPKWNRAMNRATMRWCSFDEEPENQSSPESALCEA